MTPVPLIHPLYATKYSQVDPAYKSIPLGTSTSTIGSIGCLMTSLASGLTDLGIKIEGRIADPPRLNRWLARNGGFVNASGGTSGANLLVFAAPNKLGTVKLVQFIDSRQSSAPMPVIADALATGKVVLAEVDFQPGGTLQQHWVRLLPEELYVTPERSVELLKTDVRIMDPWMPPGSELRWLMTSYAMPSWDNPARAIMRVAIYGRTDDNAGTPNAVYDTKGSVAQAAVHLRGTVA